MKKKIKIVVASIVILSVVMIGAGCGSSGYADGIYEGSSNSGMHEGLIVSVVVKDGAIAEVNVIEHGETEGIGTTAVDKLPDLIVEAQSTEIDSVGGASLSSTAIKEAVDQALSQATK